MRARLSPWRLIRSFWEGLVTLGMLHLAGETEPYDLVSRGSLHYTPLGDDPLHDVLLHNGPPPGHPERLRPDLPLTPLERRLRRELRRPSRMSRLA